MENKLLRLIEIIQDTYPEDILTTFKLEKRAPLDERIDLLCKARDFYQERAATLWRQAGQKRTPEEKRAAAKADLASFAFAYLTGDAKEHTKSACEAMDVLDRASEVGIIKFLSRF